MAKQAVAGAGKISPSSMVDNISEHRVWFTILGALLVILGIVAIIFPLATTIAAKTLLGWLFLVSGAGQVIHAFSTKRWSGFALNLLVGVLYLLVGGWLAFLPLAGILPLTVLLAAMFLVQGLLECFMAFRMQPHKAWVWMLVSGILAIAAGVLILAEFPASAVWAIGLLVGINLISSGWAYIFLAMAAQKKA